LQIEARLRVSGIEIVRGEKVMAFGSHVGDAQEGVSGELPFDRKIVLLGILRMKMRTKFAEKKDWPKTCPIYTTCWAAERVGGTRSLRRLMDNSTEYIRIWRAARLRFKGQVQQCVAQRNTAAKRRFCAELLQDKLFDRIVENAECGPNAGLSRASKDSV
jgi:hypothetical protein